MRKTLLTSVIAMAVAMPAFADNNSYTNNQTYANSCTIDVLGESSGTASATAVWSQNRYYCARGTYLPAMSSWSSDDAYTPNTGSDHPTNCEPCPANSYCMATSNFATDTAQGIYSCSSLAPEASKYLVGVGDASTQALSFPYSDAGATNGGDCYRTCVASDVPHATSITGRRYPEILRYSSTAQSNPNLTWEGVYGGGNLNQCAPTNSSSCETGYHYVAAFDPVAAGLKREIYDYGMDINSISVKYYALDGSTGSGTNYSQMGRGNWEITVPNGGKLAGVSTCNSVAGNYIGGSGGVAEPNAIRPGETSGQYCWCRATSWTPSGGSAREIYGFWITFYGDEDFSSTAECVAGCAMICSTEDPVGVPDPFYAGSYYSLMATIRTAAGCLPNEITVNFGGYGANNNQSEAMQCTYGGALQTPTTAPTKRGYTFSGWTFGSQN